MVVLNNGFNLGEEQYIYESILFGFPGDIDNTIVTITAFDMLNSIYS